jgi:hypothetical protein
MRKASPFALIVVAAISCFATPSQVCAANTIQISNQAVGTGSITCSGTYTTDAGWAVLSVTLYCSPVLGGNQSSQAANYSMGNWGPATIGGLTSGVQYNVWATMIIQKGVNMQTINSATTQLTPK